MRSNIGLIREETEGVKWVKNESDRRERSSNKYKGERLDSSQHKRRPSPPHPSYDQVQSQGFVRGESIPLGSFRHRSRSVPDKNDLNGRGATDREGGKADRLLDPSSHGSIGQ